MAATSGEGSRPPPASAAASPLPTTTPPPSADAGEIPLHTSDRPRLFGLDVARATAITLVVASHFARPLDKIGFYGVELFFALSGFLIGGILHRQLTTGDTWTFADVTRFWRRRWWRTLPNYYLFLAVNIALALWLGNLPPADQLWRYLVFSQNLVTMSNRFFLGAWSLCIEEWFYLLFPLAIYALHRAGLSRKNAFVATTALFIAGPLLLREVILPDSSRLAVRGMTLPRLDAIFYGVAMAFVCARYRPSALVRGVLAALGAVIVGSLALFHAHTEDLLDLRFFFPLALPLVPLGCALILPALALLPAPPPGSRLVTRAVEALSRWSYSIYLSHVPLLMIVYELLAPWRDAPAINLLSKLAALALTLLVSRWLYHHVEQRFLRHRPPERA